MFLTNNAPALPAHSFDPASISSQKLSHTMLLVGQHGGHLPVHGCIWCWCQEQVFLLTPCRPPQTSSCPPPSLIPHSSWFLLVSEGNSEMTHVSWWLWIVSLKPPTLFPYHNSHLPARRQNMCFIFFTLMVLWPTGGHSSRSILEDFLQASWHFSQPVFWVSSSNLQTDWED